MKKIQVILLGLILLLGGFLRVYGLDKSPPSLNWDEASLGYNAYSILKTGKDEYGKFLPIFIRSFDDYKSAIPVYLTMPFILIFGLNEIGVRMVSAFLGVVSILLVYLIGTKLFRNKTIGTFSAFFFAISPYSVFFSRALFEANIALALFLLGYLFYLYREKNSFIFLSAFFFILSMYTYHSYKLLVPLFVSILFATSAKQILADRKKIFALITFVGVLLIPIIILTLSGVTSARFTTTSILKLWPPPLVEALTNSHQLSEIYNLLIHNQYFYFLWEVAARYLSYFSPMNLFLRESAEPGLIIPTLAILPPFTFIFLLLGMFAIFKNLTEYRTLAILIVTSPIPAVITWNLFHSVRVLPLFVGFSIVSGFGAYAAWKFLAKKFKARMVYFAIIAVIGLWNAFYLFDSLMILLPLQHYGSWQPGFQESIPVVSSLQNEYEQVVIDSPHAQPYIFTLFYQAYPPEKYLKELNYEKIKVAPRNYYDFGKFKFRKIYWPEDRNRHKTLFMGTVYSLPEQDIKSTPNAKIIKDILDKDGYVNVRIVTLD